MCATGNIKYLAGNCQNGIRSADFEIAVWDYVLIFGGDSMKSDTKKYYKIPQKMQESFRARGYQELRIEDQSLFDPYYDSMNEHWSANTCFLNLIWWSDFYTKYFKIAEGLLINITYLKNSEIQHKSSKAKSTLSTTFSFFKCVFLTMSV